MKLINHIESELSTLLGELKGGIIGRPFPKDRTAERIEKILKRIKKEDR